MGLTPTPGPIKALVATALAAAMVALTVAAFRVPVGYDEAYNLQVVHNVLAGNGYATNGALFAGEPVPFDPYISTGPTLLLPIAGVSLLLGEHLWVFRLVPLFAFIALGAGWWSLGRRLAGGAWGGLAAVAAVLVVDPTVGRLAEPAILGPGDVVGELATAALLVWAATMLPRRPAAAGLLLGLAVLTKALALLAGPAFVIAVLVSSEKGSARRSGLVRLCGGAVLPTMMWQLTRYVWVGPTRARQANEAFLRFFVHGGSGLSTEESARPLDKLLEQSRLFTWPALAGVVLAAAVVVAVARHRRLRDAGQTARSMGVSSTIALASSAAAIELWWLCLADRDWARHSLIATYLGLPLLLVLLVRLTTGRNQSRQAYPALVAVGLLVATGVSLHCFAALTALRPEQVAQERMARELHRQDVGSVVFREWWQTPEFFILADTRAHRVADDDGGWILLTPLMRQLAPSEYQHQIGQCDDVRYRDGGYVLCHSLRVSTN